jgi:intein/homing endonuclease
MNFKKIKPIKLTPTTAYLAGVIIGDGHISSSTKSKSDKSKDYRIIIDLSDKEYLEEIYRMIYPLIKSQSIPKASKSRTGRKERLYFQFRNKSFFYFLTENLGIPAGAKSQKVQIPDKIKNSQKIIKKHFLAGLFDTDGGFRGRSLGFTTASKKLNEDVSGLLSDFSIKHSVENWKNKKYNKYYYGIRMYSCEIDNFLKVFPLKNREKLIRIYNKLNAGMPERPNGTVDSNQFKGESVQA